MKKLSLKKTALLTATMTMAFTCQALADTTTALRATVESKGGIVSYNNDSKEVTVNYKDTQMQFVIGSSTVNVNGNILNETTSLENGITKINADFLNNVLIGADALSSVKNTDLTLGTIKTYNFGDITLEAYITKDALYDVSYIVEKDNQAVVIESSTFTDNVKELKDYITSSGKTLVGEILAYHPNGYDILGDTPVYATENALANWGEGGSIKGLVDGFVATFGESIATNMPDNVNIIKVGESVNIGEITFNIIETGDEAFSIEIPEINCVYRHMMGSKCHNILTSVAHIDSEIASLTDYQAKNYTLVLTSHYDPETQTAIAEKIEYLKKTKELALNSTNTEEFKNAMLSEFPDYSGENYLDMTASFMFNN